MDKQIPPALIIAVIVVVVALIGFFGFRAMQPPTPPPGSYTPGVPPWMDKNHPSTASGVHDPSQAGTGGATTNH